MKRTFLSTVAVLGGLALILSAALLLSWATPARADPGVLYVAPGGNCNGATPCYGSVQGAVDAAVSGDEIRVAAGTYTGVTTRNGVTQMVYLDKSVTIQGGYSTNDWTTPDPTINPTTLDAQGQGRVLYITGNIDPLVDGLRITGGDATGLGGSLGGWDVGGGVYVVTATATIQNSYVYNNTAGLGGGLALWYSNALLIENTFTSNSASGGGGVYLFSSHGLVFRNTIASNTASWGGGLQAESSNAIICVNTITNNTSDRGGGLSVLKGYPTILANTVASNTADDGGGLLLAIYTGATLTNNAIIDNEANVGGSALYIEASSPHLSHNTVARNTGGDGSGIYVTGGPSFGGYSTVALTNTILVSHSVGISVTSGNTATINSILWDATTPITVSQTAASVTVQNELTGDPAFAADGYHLTFDSAAVDAAVDDGVYKDIDGYLDRPYGAAPDLGADELFAVTVPSGVESTVIYTDTYGRPAIIQIPNGAVTETITLVYIPVDTATSPDGFAFAGRAFDLEAYRNDVLIPGFTFSGSITITVHYYDSDVFIQDENGLTLQYWDESSGEWMDAACGSYDRHPGENWLAVPICHLSRFALFGEVHTVYLPLTMRNY
jgi:hypothetical protein